MNLASIQVFGTRTSAQIINWFLCSTLTVQITSEESRCAPRFPHLYAVRYIHCIYFQPVCLAKLCPAPASPERPLDKPAQQRR